MSVQSIAIVGGGIIGMATAWRLAQNGFDVTIFEKAGLGCEASWAAAGMLSPGGELDEHATAPELFIEGRRLYGPFVEELASRSGIAIDYQECGALELAYSENEWNAIRRMAVKHGELGIRSKPLTADQVRTFSPYVEIENLQGALFYPEDGVVAPRDVTKALCAVCAEAGVRVHERTPVEQIDVAAESATLNGQKFDRVVMAAGAWSSRLSVTGVPPLPESRPVKGHLLAFDLQPGACPTIVRHGTLYAFQRRSGLLIAGASMEQAGFDRTIDPAVANGLLAQITKMLPVVEKLEPVDVWTGLRPHADAMHIERWQNSALLLAYGHFRNGVLLAPITAEKIAALLRTAG